MKKLNLFFVALLFMFLSGCYEEVITPETVSNTLSKKAANSYNSGTAMSIMPDVVDNWAETEINYMTSNGYMSGFPDGTFKPNNNLTRAQFATMIVSCLNPTPKPDRATLTFSDIDGHWAKDKILQAARAGFLSGYPDGTFAPDQNISKLQTVVGIANGLEVSGGNITNLETFFTDYTTISDWAKQSVANALANKLILNYPSKTEFKALQASTRADATALMYRAMMRSNSSLTHINTYLVDPTATPTGDFTLNYPNPVDAGSAVTFSGTSTGITSLKFLLDGYLLGSTNPTNGNYSFTYTITNAGIARVIRVEGYNGSTLVKARNQTIDVKAGSAPVLTSRQQYDVAVGTTVWKLAGRNGFFFEAEMTINADGSPRAYHPNDIGIDYLANAGYSGNWWGIATNSSGVPYVQRSSDPYPGYYVSTTAINDSRYEARDPRRYANSETVPFMVLPASKAMGAKLGDFAVVYNQRNGKYCYAIYADVGPTNHLGEASIKAANLLGINSNPKSGGQTGDIIYLVFPNTRTEINRVPSYQTIIQEGERLFNAWGGIAQLQYFY